VSGASWGGSLPFRLSENGTSLMKIMSSLS
jgi:hypothetical protein